VATTPVVSDPIFSSTEVYGITTAGALEEDAYVTAWSGWASRGTPAGVTLTGTPSAAYDPAAGNLEVYATASNGHLEQTAYVPGTGWSAWRDLTGSSNPPLASSPEAFYDSVTGNMEVYATSTSHHLEQAAYAGGWSWNDVGGSITGTPSPVHDAIHKFTEVYATGTDGALYEFLYTTSWAVNSRGGAISGSPSAIYDPITSNLEIYAAGSGASGDNVEQLAFVAGSGWQAWRNLGGAITGSPVALADTVTGDPEVYATATSGHLSRTIYTTSWSSWVGLGTDTTITGTPVPFIDQVTTALDIYAVTTSNVIAQLSWKGTWAASWHNLGATPTFSAP
jgi:hypothetical protein